MRIVFLGSPWAGDERKHEAYATAAMRHAIGAGVIPIVPHLMYPRVLVEDSGPARAYSMRMGAHLLRRCDELWLYVDLGISAGMKSERGVARKAGIVVHELRVPAWLDDGQAENFMELLTTEGILRDDPEETALPAPKFKAPEPRSTGSVEIHVPEGEIDEETFNDDDEDEPPPGPILGSA